VKPGDLPVKAQARLSEFNGRCQDSMDSMRNASARIERIRSAAAYDKRGLNETESLEVLRLESTREKHRQRHDSIHALCQSLQQWLSKLRNVQVVVAPPPVSSQADGETIQAYIARLRDQIYATQNHMAAVQHAPLPLKDRKQLVRSYVEQLVERGRPRVDVINDSLRIDHVDPQKVDFLSQIDIDAKLAWFDADKLAKRYEAELAPDQSDAISASEREKQLTELRAVLDAYERQEEAAITQAEAMNIEIERRQDADPQCVLNVVVKRAAQAAAA
jgi:hypothetical protein